MNNCQSTVIYRVRDWDSNFENHESRKIRCLQWVPMKNKHDGSSYRRVASLKNAVDVFCAWSLIIQVASRMPERGVLCDKDGPLTASDLAWKTGFPERIFKLAFEVLSQPDIRWITGESPGISRLVPQHPDTSGKIRVEGKGRELKGREDLPPTPKGEENGGFAYPKEFQTFWAAYPRKVQKGAALKAWNRIKGRPSTEVICTAVATEAASEQWQKDGGQFIPHPATWLNGRGWDDVNISNHTHPDCTESHGEGGSVIGWMLDERARLDALEATETHEMEVED